MTLKLPREISTNRNSSRCIHWILHPYKFLHLKTNCEAELWILALGVWGCVLGIKLRTLYVLSKRSTTELHTHSLVFGFLRQGLVIHPRLVLNSGCSFSFSWGLGITGMHHYICPEPRVLENVQWITSATFSQLILKPCHFTLKNLRQEVSAF
jgi:hypothetical protein